MKARKEAHKEPRGKHIANEYYVMVWIALLLMLLSPASVSADHRDYSDADFSVRLPPAFVRFTEISTLGGDTAANRTAASINPASDGWMSIPSTHGLVVAPAYSATLFSSGTNAHVISEALTWDSREWGTFQPVLNQIRTNEDVDRQGLEFDYSVDTGMLQWGKRFDNWALGACYSFSDAEVINRLETATVSDTTAETSRFRFGGLYEPVEKWLAGLVFEYGFTPYDTDALAMTPGGPMPVHFDGTEEQYILRPAISYEYAQLSTVYFDWEHGSYHTNRDLLEDDRFSAGVEHRLLEGLFLRTTGSFDSRGNTGWNVGATAFISQCCSMDVGYQYNMFPELHPEFGYSNTIQATLSARF
jgi:hypothetical protein